MVTPAADHIKEYRYGALGLGSLPLLGSTVEEPKYQQDDPRNGSDVPGQRNQAAADVGRCPDVSDLSGLQHVVQNVQGNAERYQPHAPPHPRLCHAPSASPTGTLVDRLSLGGQQTASALACRVGGAAPAIRAA